MRQRETGVRPAEGTGALTGLRRRWPLVVVGVLLGVGAAAALTEAQDVRYAATTSVLVLATDVDASLSTSRPEVNMDTEAELVRSAQVAEVTGDLLGVPATPATLLSGLEVTVPLNSQVLAITYHDRTAAAAQAGAQAFAQGYLKYRGDEIQRDVSARSSALEADLGAAQQELRLATDKAAALPANSPDRVFAEAQRGIVANRISSLSARLSALRAGSPAPGQIITAATFPESPSSPTTELNYAGGLLTGLLLGFALAGIADRFDRRLWDPEHVTRWVGQPVLLSLRRQPGTPRLADAPAADAFDRLRNALVVRGELPELLQVMDPGGRGASGSVTAGMAQSVVRMTGSAIIVLAHDHSALTQWLDLGDRDGLSEVLRGTVDFEEALVESEQLPGVRVLPLGRSPQALATLLQSRHARVVLQAMRGSGTTTIIETLGAGQSAAAQTVASVSDKVLVVVERRVTDHRLVTASVAACEQVQAAVAGIVLTPSVRARLVPRVRRSDEAEQSAAATAVEHDALREPFADAPSTDRHLRRVSGSRSAPGRSPVTTDDDVAPAVQQR